MIAYYVHHHGRGHLDRASAVAAHLPQPVTFLGTPPEAGSGPAPDGNGAEWVALDRDDESDGDADPTAGGLLHWAPSGVPGHTRRLATMATWIADTAPSVVVVDISVEVTVLARLLGCRVATFVLPGDRSDRAHQLGFAAADRIIAAWPDGAELATGLDHVADKVRRVGGITAATVRPVGGITAARPTPGRHTGTDTRHAVLLTGAGGHDGDLDSLAAAHPPGWRWALAGPGQWRTDLPELLATADVVVTHAGQGAIATVAACGIPAVVVPQRRPFGEQDATAAYLGREGYATVLPAWPAQWGPILDAAARRPTRWCDWETDGAAARAADAIMELAR